MRWREVIRGPNDVHLIDLDQVRRFHWQPTAGLLDIVYPLKTIRLTAAQQPGTIAAILAELRGSTEFRRWPSSGDATQIDPGDGDPFPVD